MDEQNSMRETVEPSDLAWLLEWSRLLRSEPSEQALQRALEMAAQITRSGQAALWTLDESGQGLAVEALVGSGAMATTRVKLGEGMAGWVAQNRRPLRAPDGEDVPAAIRESLSRDKITSALCVPLDTEGSVLGALSLGRLDDSPSFNAQELMVASLLAEQMAAVLHISQLNSQLEGQKRFIALILENIPSSLVVIDRSLRVVSVNHNFLEKGRREMQSTLGHKIEEVFPPVLVEYTRLNQKAAEAFRTGQSVDGGKVAYRAPGLPTRTYYYRLIPLKVEGAVENVMILLDDVTEREQLGQEVQQAERHLASVVECANDLVVSMNPRGQIVTWNLAAERISGLKIELVQGKSLLSLCIAEQKRVMTEVLQKLAGGRSVQNIEVDLLITGGRFIPIAWSFSSMRDDAGKVVGIVAVGRDLTERRRLESQLIQSAKMASLGVMAGGIAHEVRNPLGIISAAAQLLRESPNDAKLRGECAAKIHAATQRASLIIENLMKFSRPEGAQMRATDLLAVLEATLSLLRNQLSLQKVVLQETLQPDLPKVYANPDLLQQVFTNLVLNARNAMAQGGTLTIAARSTKRDVEVSFSDTGNGISPEILPKIFDPFFTTMPVGKGIGLGLSISYSIIQQFGGTIEAVSKVGEGTTLVVHLPVHGRM